MEKRVFILDDEEDIGLMVSGFVKKAGMSPVYCSRVEPALEIVSSSKFDSYLLDLNLPDGTGFDLIPTIKKQNPEGQIIIISAYDSDSETARAEELGVKAFVKKPFTRKELLAHIEN